VACVERDGEIGIDGDFVFDRYGNFAGYGAAGGRASNAAGGRVVDFGGGYFFVVDTRGVDLALNLPGPQSQFALNQNRGWN